MHDNNDLIITGCSYNGMISALALANSGIKSTIVERRVCQGSFFDDPRTTSITSFSQTFFDEIGVWSKIKEFTSPVKDIYVVDNKNPNMLHFNCQDDEYLGYMIENTIFKKALYELASNNSSITIKEGACYESVDLSQDGATLHLSDGQSIKSELVILCDGRNSPLRAKYFPYLINKDYKELALVFNVSHEKMHENCAVEHFLSTGPFAILPLQDQHSSAIVWSIELELGIMYKNLSPELFETKVQEMFGDFLGKIKIITPVSYFNLSAQVVRHYFFGNLVLVGDSAHCIHPLAGQGLNQGIKDIQALIKVIKKYQDLGLELNAVAWEEYQKERRFDNFKMFAATDFLDKIFTNKSKTIGMIRNIGFKFFNRFPRLKDKITRYGIGR
jgi:2-octaprenyl-6-methoxyphenol hydroxylase